MSDKRKIECRKCGGTTYELVTDVDFRNAKLACEACGEVLPFFENRYTGTRLLDRSQE